MATLEHRASRVVDQTPEVVHARLLELATRLRDEMPPIDPGSQAATLLGMSGPLAVEIRDLGPTAIEFRTMQGRIRAHAGAAIDPAPNGRTNLTLAMQVKPEGFAANLMLGVAMKAMPDAEKRVIDGLESGLDDLVAELAKPDDEWDANAWTPPGIPTAG